jgi:CBS domain-containing protein
MQIKDIMSTHVDTVVEEATLAQVAQKMRDDDVGALPVADGQQLIGMITDRDIVVRSVADGCDVTATTARDAMSRDLVYCRNDDSVDAVSKKMADWKIRRLPVLDRSDRLVGMVSLGDLSRSEPGASGEALSEISKPTGSPRRSPQA